MYVWSTNRRHRIKGTREDPAIQTIIQKAKTLETDEDKIKSKSIHLILNVVQL